MCDPNTLESCQSSFRRRGRCTRRSGPGITSGPRRRWSRRRLLLPSRNPLTAVKQAEGIDRVWRWKSQLSAGHGALLFRGKHDEHEGRLHPKSADGCALGHEAFECTYPRWRNSCPGASLFLDEGGTAEHTLQAGPGVMASMGPVIALNFAAAIVRLLPPFRGGRSTRPGGRSGPPAGPVSGLSAWTSSSGWPKSFEL